MIIRFRAFHAAMLALALVLSPAAVCQPAPPGDPMAPAGAPMTPAEPLPQDQMDALLAPVALYPDQLLTQVLMASTYPLEVVAAARFVQQNPSLQGPDLDQALLDKPWDPSVQSLAAFPQVLAMMNDKLDWTQQLGDAFLANEPQVMDTVQSLRARAQSAGNLQSTPQQNVVVQEKYIYIEPAQPQVVYVPVYNPTIVYGPWWAPRYRPWYWYPPPIYGYPPAPIGGVIAAGIVWGTAWAITANNWGWARPNWGGHSINVNINNTTNIFINHRPQYRTQYSNGQWQHLPEHRQGVAYRDSATRDRYQRQGNAGVNTRENYRGYDNSRSPPRTAADRPPGGNAGGSAGGGSTRPGGSPGARPPGEAPGYGTGQRPGGPGTPAGQTPGGGATRPGGPGTPAGQPPGAGTGTRPGGPGTRPESPPAPAAQPASPPTRPATPPTSPNANRPTPQPTPTLNTGESRPQVQMESSRGQASRQTMTRPAPQAQPQTAPQMQPQNRPQGQPQSRPQGQPQTKPQGQPQNRPSQGSPDAPAGRGGGSQRGNP